MRPDHATDSGGIDLVIFDCDGVLVDSERTTTRLLAEVITEMGRPTSVEDAIRDFKGTDLSVIRARLEEEVGRPFDALLETYRGRMFPALSADCPEIAGVSAMLDAVDGAGVGRCVASNGPMQKIETTLRASGLAPRFEPAHIFSAYVVGKWKPDPGLFLHAAEAMGVDPARCAVVEDSVSGVVAARAAGMRVFAYADLTSQADLTGAGADGSFGRVFRRMADLPGLLGIVEAADDLDEDPESSACAARS